METTVGDDTNHVYSLGMSDLKRLGKRSLEWDLNNCKWDGDLFFANQLNSAPGDCPSRQFFPLGSGIPETGNSSNSSSSCSEEANLEKEKRGLEKRSRLNMADHASMNDDVGALSLKLGGHGSPIPERQVVNWDGAGGKKTKLAGTSSSRAVCQVEECCADLSKAKDYHRRHKVCEMHSKANMALVGNIMQRFCQQCSRFHDLQEFDEGKRSCRRRLAGHNKRRRKTHPDAVNGSSLNDEQASGYLLISLLKILSNMHSDKSEQMKVQDLLSHLLKSLVNQAGQNMSGLFQGPNDLLNDKTSAGNSGALLANGPQCLSKADGRNFSTLESVTPLQCVHDVNDKLGGAQIASSSKAGIKYNTQAYSEVRDCTVERMKLNDFDLNDTYIDLDDPGDETDRLPVVANLGARSSEFPSCIQQDSNHSSPPQTSGQSDSASAQSPSSSNGDAQSRTDRIVFKLFGKEPKDIPLALRAQILDWLSHSPSDIESYIRPGCIILTIYLRLADPAWEELCCNLTSSLSRLLDVTDGIFWRTGWLYIRVQNQIAFVYNGRVVVDMPLLLSNDNNAKISSVKPIAVSTTAEAHFSVKGFNLFESATRLLCALEGEYLVQGATHELIEGDDIDKGDVDLQGLSFSCSIPSVLGRGFIEIEDYGLGSSFFPFIVVEEDVCSEIRMLESAMDFDETCENINQLAGKTKAKNEAINFIHEMGWLLHRSRVKSRLGDSDSNPATFSFERLRWLMDFSMEHDWCAVVNKLLDIFLEGIVDLGDHGSLKSALFDMNLLHRAVRRRSRPLVELLLRYVPARVSDGLVSELRSSDCMLFTPDVEGPAGLTPLHIAAGRDGSEDVLDALTDDPQMVGLAGWKKASSSKCWCTPEDYARLRGHYSYIHLVQRKIIKRTLAAHHQVLVDMPLPPFPPAPSLDPNAISQKQMDPPLSEFEIWRPKGPCKLCDWKPMYRTASQTLVPRSMMVSMVAIAAVCVCVALFFKTFPTVMNRSMRWESLACEPR